MPPLQAIESVAWLIAFVVVNLVVFTLRNNSPPGRERYLLEELTANNVFSCGSPLLPPIHPLRERISMRLFHSCDDPVEVAFYCSYLDSSNVCCYCGSSDKKLCEELALPRCQDLLPVCEQCKLTGRQARSFLPEKRSNKYEGEEDSHF